MAQPLVGTDLDFAADVGGHLTAKVTFDHVVGLDVVTQSDQLLVSQVLHACVGINAGGLVGLGSAGGPHAVDISKCDHRALFARDVHTSQTCHMAVLLVSFRRSSAVQPQLDRFWS